eukprot:TRINITY_DN304_c0_g1_i7.p2 TRINITY_DN304_c0_g1~~TRINITY_DN304_c0_g1_i7.p2  ORF type:complete len:165 (-),score=64.41 TRINITY_DN304_c0_g1_i7:59-484(-)
MQSTTSTTIVTPVATAVPATAFHADGRPVAAAAEARENKFLSKEQKVNYKLEKKQTKRANKFERKVQKIDMKLVKLRAKGKTASLIKYEARRAEFAAAAQIHRKAAADARLHASHAGTLQAVDKTGAAPFVAAPAATVPTF